MVRYGYKKSEFLMLIPKISDKYIKKSVGLKAVFRIVSAITLLGSVYQYRKSRFFNQRKIAVFFTPVSTHSNRNILDPIQ
jgi:hypothetical protein